MVCTVSAELARPQPRSCCCRFARRQQINGSAEAELASNGDGKSYVRGAEHVVGVIVRSELPNELATRDEWDERESANLFRPDDFFQRFREVGCRDVRDADG